MAEDNKLFVKPILDKPLYNAKTGIVDIEVLEEMRKVIKRMDGAMKAIGKTFFE